MKTEIKRVSIYPKDIQCITRKSYRQSTRLMQKIRKDLNKRDNEFLSIDEICQYTSLKYEQIEQHILS